jgi:hypothetical protein
MMRIVSPAPLPDVLDLHAQVRPLKRDEFRAAMLQHARSESCGFYAGDKILAAFFLYPAPAERPGEDLRELAFACRPEFARHLVEFTRYGRAFAARLTAAARPDDPPLRIRATVRTGHRPGERLAALFGLRAVGTAGTFTRYELELAGHGICLHA